MKMTPEQREEFLADLAQGFREEYLWPEKGRRIAEELEAQARAGYYARQDGAEDFVALLNRELYRLSHDLHLSVSLHEDKEEPHSRSPRSVLTLATTGDDIVQLKLDSFPEPAEAFRKELQDTLESIGSPAGLVIDLRDNAGGSDDCVNHLLGAFFAERTHLATSHRWNSDPVELFARPLPCAARLSRTPLVVLTSRATFSAAEIFTQRLQHHGRAQVAGEATSGAAHRTMTYLMCDLFLLHWPWEYSCHARSGQDLEGIGIRPDLPASYSAAPGLALAHLAGNRDAALSRPLEHAPPEWAELLVQALNTSREDALPEFVSRFGEHAGRSDLTTRLERFQRVWNTERNLALVASHQVDDHSLRLFLRMSQATVLLRVGLAGGQISELAYRPAGPGLRPANETARHE